MIDKTRADQVAGAVFLIGIGVVAYFSFWWPGILFVIGFSSMARGVAEGRDWYSVPGGLWMIGLGLVFAFGFSWPLILILIGMSMLFGKEYMGRRSDEENAKRQIETGPEPADKAKHDSYMIDESASGDETTVEDLLDPDTRNS